MKNINPPPLDRDLFGKNLDKLMKNFADKEKERLASLSQEELDAEKASIQAEIQALKQIRDEINVHFGKEIVVRYWSRAPGKFVEKETGKEILGDQFLENDNYSFVGTVRQWYGFLNEVLLETINLHERLSQSDQKDMFIITSPDTLTILEHTHPFVFVQNQNQIGSMLYESGTIFNVPVYKDPFFPSNYIFVVTGKPETPLVITSASVVKVLDMMII